MNEEECKHEWIEDERFKSGGVIMLFGNIGDVHEETRVICRKCRAINYIKRNDLKQTSEEKQDE